MLGYVKNHWLGQHSLAWSFWINLVAIRLTIFVFQNYLAPEEGADYSDSKELVLAATLFAHLLLLVWQVTGVIRATDSHFQEHGNIALVWGAQLGSVLMLVLTGVYSLGAIQMTMTSAETPDVIDQMNAEHARQYSVEIKAADRESAFITGTIELGITSAFKQLLVENSQINTVVLDSAGGNIYEARGLFSVIVDNGLNTRVDSTCASACIIAFAGGKRRSAGDSARFGFHQYRIDASYTIIATDVAREQRRDQQLLLDAGVDDKLVDLVFSHESASMWWPSRSVLLSGGFIHRISSSDVIR